MRKLKRFYVLPVWLCLIFFPYGVFSQSPNDVIINEVLNGSSFKDAVELLVTKPGGVDMRGWIISDLDSPTRTPGASDGYCTFPQNPFLQNVPQFTRIVLVFIKSTNVGSPVAAQDTIVAGDSTLVLFSFGADSLLIPTTSSSGVNLGDNDNLVLIAGSLTSNNIVDKIYYGTGVDTSWTGGTWRNNFANVAIGTFAYFSNDSIGGYINDNGETGKGWAAGIAEANHTLGRINPGQLTGGKSIRIRNITRNPVAPNSAQPVIIHATVGSLNAVSSVKTIYSYDAVMDSVDMSLVSDSTYRDTIPAMPKNKKVYYYIKAIDVGNNIETSAVDSFTVTPSIVFAQIVRNPVSPDSNQSATITAKISSFNPVISAKLFYSLKGVTDSVTMSNTSDTTYQGTIPAKKVGDTVSYFISVADNAGQVELSSASQYIVVMPIVITSISSIQGDTTFFKGRTVTIAGIVVIGDSKLSTWRQTYIVDRSDSVNGIQIYSSSITGDTLKRGDSVVVTGLIGQYNSVTQISNPLTYSIISRNNTLPIPRTRTVSQVSDLNREGEWVKIKGSVVSKSSGPNYNVGIEDATGNITVRIWGTTGINTTPITVGQSYFFSGVIGLFGSGTQLLPGYNEDIVTFLDTAGVGDYSKANIKVSPYPFNPTAGEKVRYALQYGNDSRVIVRLFDVSGRLVTTLIDEVKSLGRDESKKDILDTRTWDGRTIETKQLVPVGTYLMHLEVTDRKTGKSSYKTAPVVIGTKLK